MRSPYPRADFTRREITTMIRLAEQVDCPGTNPGCECRQCGQRPDRLHTSTFVDAKPPMVAGPRCTGAMTCRCWGCERERARRVRIGVKQIKQPWHVAA